MNHPKSIVLKRLVFDILEKEVDIYIYIDRLLI